MKTPLLSLLALGISVLGANGQVVEVASVQQVKLANPLTVTEARISPDGSFAIVSDAATAALHRIDLSSGTATKITDNGSLLELQFSPDGSAIVFKRSITGEHHLRYHSVETIDLASGTSRQLARPARHAANFSVTRQGALTLAGEAVGGLRAVKFGAKGQSSEAGPVVGINRGHLELTLPDGTVKNLDPQGRGSYLWPSISPDGTKITYFKCGSGCYVCDIDGSNARPLGYLHAPVWLGNDKIVGCQDFDNGTVITSSTIVAMSLDGTSQTLTDGSLLGISPSVSSDAKTISFSGADGKLYLINLK